MNAFVESSIPSSIDAERRVIGGMLIDNGCVFAVRALVAAGDFYNAEHRRIFDATVSMVTAGKPCDVFVLVDYFDGRGELDEVGGRAHIVSFAEEWSSANVEVHAKVVKDRARRRMMLDFAERLARQAQTADSDELIGAVTAQMNGILSATTTAASKKFGEVAEGAKVSIERAAKQTTSNKVVGVPLGLAPLDRLLGGLIAGRLYILAARPKCGKSLLLNQGGIHSAMNSFPGLIVSTELGAEEIGIRGMAYMAGTNVTRLSRGDKTESDLAFSKLNSAGDFPLWVDDKTTDLDEIVAQIALHYYRHKIRWAAVDLIGKVRTKVGANTNERIGHITWTLKQLAKRLGIAIIGVCQLGRACDKENRRPRPDDLRDSGEIEQDADAVIMLHVPLDKRDELRKPMQIGVPLNRNGPALWLTDDFTLNGETQTISINQPDRWN